MPAAGRRGLVLDCCYSEPVPARIAPLAVPVQPMAVAAGLYHALAVPLPTFPAALGMHQNAHAAVNNSAPGTYEGLNFLVSCGQKPVAGLVCTGGLALVHPYPREMGYGTVCFLFAAFDMAGGAAGAMTAYEVQGRLDLVHGLLTPRWGSEYVQHCKLFVHPDHSDDSTWID